MITLLSGTDQNSILNFLKGRKKNYSTDSIQEYDYSDVEISINEIIDAIQTTGMFTTTKLIILYPKKWDNVDFSEEVLASLKEDPDNELIIVTGSLRKNTKIYKKLAKYSGKQSFDKPKDYSGFNFVDAIFIDSNKIDAIKQLRNMAKIEEESPLVVSNLYNGLRNYISVKSKNTTSDKIHPFIKKKMVNSRYQIDLNQAQKLYLELFELDIKTKTMGVGKQRLIEDFVIYSV